jgi:hypothetical protein
LFVASVVVMELEAQELLAEEPPLLLVLLAG